MRTLMPNFQLVCSDVDTSTCAWTFELPYLQALFSITRKLTGYYVECLTPRFLGFQEQYTTSTAI